VVASLEYWHKKNYMLKYNMIGEITVKNFKRILFISALLIIGFFTYKAKVLAATVVTGTCYCCGNSSQGCSYTWKTTGSTAGSNCAVAKAKIQTTCYGWNTSAGSGACWRCCVNRDCIYKWSSTGASPSSNCGYVSSIKDPSYCSGTHSEKVGGSYNWSDDDTTTDNGDSDGETTDDEETDGPDVNINVGEATCSGILGSGKFHQYLVDILNAIRIVGVAMVIIFSTMDFGKALITQDSEALKKASQTAFKRLMIAIVIFFVPIILNILLALVGLSGICI